MNLLEKKKLNLLIHLAKIDGKFDKTEKELLRSFIREKGLEEKLVDYDEYPMRCSEFAAVESKIELLY